MPDYNKYRQAAGITNNDIIAVLQEKYPNFIKVHCSMINNAEKTGLRLTAEAERLLASNFGYHEGLDIKPPAKREVKRVKSNRLAVRLNDRDYDMVKSKMQEMGCKSVQSFFETLLADITGKENDH